MPRSYETLKSKGICVSCKHNKADANYVTCTTCRNKQRKAAHDRRLYYKSHGICPNCGTEQLVGSEKLCIECQAKKYAQNRESKAKYDAEYYRKRRQEMIDNGICVQCGRKAKPGRTMCEICLDKKKRYRREQRGDIPRSERLSYGLCYICGDVLDNNRRLCVKCCEKVQSNLPESSKETEWYKYHQRQNKILYGT